MKRDLLKDSEFKEVTEVKLDSKRRITLGRIVTHSVSGYHIYRNNHGQLILDPLTVVPAYEAWIFKNKKVSWFLEKGLEDARKGRVVKAKEDYSKHMDGE